MSTPPCSQAGWRVCSTETNPTSSAWRPRRACCVASPPAGRWLFRSLRAAHDPREARDAADAHSDRDLLEAGPQDRDDDEREEDSGERQLDVDDAHEDAIEPAAAHPRDEPDQASGHGRDRHRGEADGQRGAAAVDESQQHVAAELVGAQEMSGGARRQQRIAEALLERIDRDGRGQHEDRGDEDDEIGEHDHPEAIRAEAPPGARVRARTRGQPRERSLRALQRTDDRRPADARRRGSWG